MTHDTAKPEILVIDDEVQIRRLLRFTLEEADYVMREAETGQAGLSEVAHRRPDAIILDLGLPDLSGVEVLKRLREWSPIPVLILSVLGQEKNKIAALDAGADDYLTKPFGGGELLARLRVLLRRVQSAEEPKAKIEFGPIEVDLIRRLVTKDGHAVKLTAREYALLRLFIVHRGKVLTHRQILSELWGPKAKGQTHYLRVYMMRLRQKLENDPDTPQYLQTESGVGYRLSA
ncbi:MAG TPA: response regulator [Opitutaceae bacterium]|jgi:two-component system KDP operon response regulator KdpE|nr:response regulator [Opitutaceae bacterium]